MIELVKGLKSYVGILKEHTHNIIIALISISFFNNENRVVLVDNGLVPILFDFINCKEFDFCRSSLILLSNVCHVSSFEIKNTIIKKGIFGILHKKLLSLQTSLLSSNYCSLYDLCNSISKLVEYNSEGVDMLLNSPLISSLLQTLELVTSIVEISSGTPNVDVVNIQRRICVSFVSCTSFSYEQCDCFVKYEVIPFLLVLLEKHMNMMKKKGKKMGEWVVRHAASILFNVSYFGYKKAVNREKNKFRGIFDGVNGMKRLYGLFSYLHNQKNQSSLERETINYISLCVCRLLKSDTIPPLYVSLLVYVNELRSQPKPESGDNFPLSARICWDGLIEANEYLIKYSK
jgi:hypothetical protein